jgi:ABC-type dipeptide/oligopeptide/nickel transport system permease component
VFDHIFKNAQFQYLSTLKEQASFLITGLIIIEMALNIHGHLSYELLRQLLYKNYSIVTVIILGIFYTVKLTEIATDYFIHRQTLRYENRESTV